MSHHHAQPTASHSHQRGTQNKLRTAFLTHMHDTELWASYLPRVPNGLYLLAFIGFAFGVASFSTFVPDSALLKFSTLTLGVLLILPAILARSFARRKWNYVSTIRKQIFDSVALRGDEKVLDVGCGSGPLLNGAALRLTTGRATGIDIWAPHSGGGNHTLLMKNAQAEGVADKIEFKQADVRKLPFGDATFDIIVSSGALHHISHDRAEHELAIDEMLRVLKPGGQLALMDIAHIIEGYASSMKAKGVAIKVNQTVQSPFGFELSVMIGKKEN